MNRIKHTVFLSSLILGTLILLAGCKDLTGPEGPGGTEGLNAGDGPFGFTIGESEFGPLTGRDVFSAALKTALESQPEGAGTVPENPITLTVSGLDVSQKDSLAVLYGALSGRYVALDLSRCTGTSFAVLSPALYSENKAGIVSLVLPETLAIVESGSPANSTTDSVAVGAFLGFTGLKSVEMPGIVYIGDYAFSGTALETLNCPKLTTIGSYAFSGCSTLAAVTLPRLETIDTMAFQTCVQLENVNFPDVTSLGAGAFSGCSTLAAVTLPRLETTGSTAFQNCVALENVNFPEVTSIGAGAFSGCSTLAVVTLPRLETIDNMAFQNCVVLENVNFPEVTSIGAGAFSGCSNLATVTLPHLETIGNTAFQNCVALGVVNFPEVTSIGTSAFNRCSILAAVTLPKLASIGNTAFQNCVALAEITLGETPPATVGTNVFQNTGGTTSSKKQITLKVPTAKTGDYETWKSSNSSKLNLTTVALNVTGI
jgi:hypothetical protein